MHKKDELLSIMPVARLLPVAEAIAPRTQPVLGLLFEVHRLLQLVLIALSLLCSLFSASVSEAVTLGRRAAFGLAQEGR